MQNASYVYNNRLEKSNSNLTFFDALEHTHGGMKVNADRLTFIFLRVFDAFSFISREAETLLEGVKGGLLMRRPLCRQRHTSVRRVLDSWSGQAGCHFPITINAGVIATGGRHQAIRSHLSLVNDK